MIAKLNSIPTQRDSHAADEGRIEIEIYRKYISNFHTLQPGRVTVVIIGAESEK